MKEFAQAPASLLLPDRLRMYFSCRPARDSSGQYVSHSAFVDLDRSDPRRVLRVAGTPILPLGEIGTFDEFGIYPVSVARFGDEELRAYYGGWTRCTSVPFNVAIGVASSRDGGETFRRLGAGPVLSYAPDEPFILSGPKIRRFQDKWFLFYIAGRKWKQAAEGREPVYRIRVAWSEDGLSWTRGGKDLIETRVEEDEAQASPDVFFHGGRYHMFFCYRFSTGFRSSERGYRIGYAWSDDLLEWTREDLRAGLDVSPAGWDSQMVSYPHLFELDGSIYMAYLGNDVGREGFGLAVLEGALD